MNVPVVYRPEVPAEIDDAIQWYETQQAGRGRLFYDALREQISNIQLNPQLYAAEYRGVRACLVGPYAYVIYYRLATNRIEVIAIQHGRRNPRAWRLRARD